MFWLAQVHRLRSLLPCLLVRHLISVLACLVNGKLPSAVHCVSGHEH